jgi:hypothetical protein
MIKKYFPNFLKSKPKIKMNNNQMYLAFYKAEHGTITDKFVSSVIRSKYSHVEFVFSDGVCASASPREKGVRFKKINLNNGKWDLYPIKQSILNETKVSTWFLKHLGQKYDTLGAIGSGIGLNLYSEDKKFCSLCLAIIFNLNDINLNPETLRLTLLKKGFIGKCE